MSNTADLFSGVLRAYCRGKGYPDPQPEHQFHAFRKWAFDFAWPEFLLALEIEGGTRLKGGGRHNRAVGYEEDARKYTEAALLGWRVVRCTWAMVNAGEVWDFLDRALAAHPNPAPEDAPHDGRRGA